MKRDIFKMKEWRYQDDSAINALEVRINHEEMKLMIHHEYEWSMIDLYQESERRERDEKIINTMTIFWENIIKEINWIIEKERDDILR